jgi:hypothetical protein
MINSPDGSRKERNATGIPVRRVRRAVLFAMNNRAMQG